MEKSPCSGETRVLLKLLARKEARGPVYALQAEIVGSPPAPAFRS